MSKGTIMILAGGTGGHVYPALTVAQEFTKQGFDIIWIGTKNGIESYLVPEHGFKIDWLNISGLRGNGFRKLFFAPSMLIRAVFQMIALFKKYKPILALGMGGFVAGPGGVVAKLMACPLIIHEQNSIPGVTNKLLARVANRVLTGFPNVLTQYLKTYYVGNPVRQSIQSTKKEEKGSINILVFGGSLGARAINEVMPEVVVKLKNENLKFNVVHQTGKLDYQTVLSSYPKNKNVQIIEYINNMDGELAKADIAICRAGAMTVAEVSMAGLPAIFIPYPFAVDDHQTTNTKNLVDANGAILLPQTQLTALRLTEELLELCNNLDTLKTMSKNALSKAKPNATREIVAYCLAEVKDV